MHAAPTLPKISIDILLGVAQKVWPEMNVAYFTNGFQSNFTAGGWRMYHFNLH